MSPVGRGNDHCRGHFRPISGQNRSESEMCVVVRAKSQLFPSRAQATRKLKQMTEGTNSWVCAEKFVVANPSKG